MADKQQGKKKGGARKIGRSKRKGQDQNLSLYVKGSITFETYFARKYGRKYKVGELV